MRRERGSEVRLWIRRRASMCARADVSGSRVRPGVAALRVAVASRVRVPRRASQEVSPDVRDGKPVLAIHIYAAAYLLRS